MADELSYGPEAFPWTLYFNGEVMPKWAAMWHWWDYRGALEASRAEGSFSCDFNLEHVTWIQQRIDHVGIVESADVSEFRLTAIILLGALLHNEETALQQIRDSAMASKAADEPLKVFADIRDGLIGMYHLATQANMAFWTNGYEIDRARLAERIRRSHLPRDHAEFEEAPHEIVNRTLFEHEIASARKELRMLSRSQPPPANLAWWLQLLAPSSDINV